MNRLLILLAIRIPPIGFIYLFAAINLGMGYRKLFCSGATPTFRGRVIEKLESRGFPVPSWLRKEPESCSPRKGKE